MYVVIKTIRQGIKINNELIAVEENVKMAKYLAEEAMNDIEENIPQNLEIIEKCYENSKSSYIKLKHKKTNNAQMIYYIQILDESKIRKQSEIHRA